MVTYTSIGLALSVLVGRFFAAVAFLAVIYGTKMVITMIESTFDSSISVASPYGS